MKWVLVKYPSASVHKYQLVEGSAVKVVLKYNHEQQSTRISSDGNHRLFFAELLTGLWNNKVIFTSEYGVESGKLVFEKGHYAGTIEMTGRKYQFVINKKEVPELVIYKRTTENPVAVCDLAIEDIKLALSITYQKEPTLEIASLLLGLCWNLVTLALPAQSELVPVRNAS